MKRGNLTILQARSPTIDVARAPRASSTAATGSATTT